MMLDLRLPGMHGFDVLERAKTADPDLEVIVITAVHGVETAVESIRRGASMHVVKPLDIEISSATWPAARSPSTGSTWITVA